MNRLYEAKSSYEQALKLDPENKEAKKSLETIKNMQNANRNGSQTRPQQGQQESQPQSPPPGQGGLGSLFNRAQNYFNGIQTNQLWDHAKRSLSEYSGKLLLWWNGLSLDHQKYIKMGLIALLVYYFFFSGSRYRQSYQPYDDYMDPGYGYGGNHYYGGGYSSGLSWTHWGMIMFAAYKVPPMFPDLLGEYARPFFGLNWTTFMWLVSMLTRNGYRGPMGGGFGGFRRHPRRYF